jgi:hypothetical protein
MNSVVGRVLDRHEVVPGGQVAHQRLGVDAAQLFLTHREGDHRHVGGLQALVAQFLVEGHVGVAVDGGHHGRLLALAGELLDLGDDGLVVAVAEGGVLLHDVGVGMPLLFRKARSEPPRILRRLLRLRMEPS